MARFAHGIAVSAGALGALASLALALGACDAVLGLRDIAEGPPALDAASPPSDGGASDRATMADAPSDVADAGIDAEGGATGFCAAYPTALLCDDFESGQFATKWQLIQQGVTPFADVRARNGAVDGGANQREGYFWFMPIPNTGVSALSVPMANGRRSLRLDVNTPLNGWPASGTAVARMVDASLKGIRIVAELVTGTMYKWAARADDADGGSTLVADMGYVVPDLWTCLAVEVDTDGTVRAWNGSMLSMGGVSPSIATTPLEAQVGLMWSYIGNSGSKHVEIDNVVVGSGTNGCL